MLTNLYLPLAYLYFIIVQVFLLVKGHPLFALSNVSVVLLLYYIVNETDQDYEVLLGQKVYNTEDTEDTEDYDYDYLDIGDEGYDDTLVSDIIDSYTANDATEDTNDATEDDNDNSGILDHIFDLDYILLQKANTNLPTHGTDTDDVDVDTYSTYESRDEVDVDFDALDRAIDAWLDSEDRPDVVDEKGCSNIVQTYYDIKATTPSLTSNTSYDDAVLSIT